MGKSPVPKAAAFHSRWGKAEGLTSEADTSVAGEEVTWNAGSSGSVCVDGRMAAVVADIRAGVGCVTRGDSSTVGGRIGRAVSMGSGLWTDGKGQSKDLVARVEW